MRIHSDTLTRNDLADAATRAGVTFYRFETRGSRSRARAHDVILEGTGRTGTRYGQNTDMIAATWDEWGIFLAELFRRDPGMTIPRVYEDAEQFRWATGGRFDELTPAEQHIRHKWERDGFSAGNGYGVSECKCGAVHRWLYRGTWSDISSLV